jgi:hypothetical protein
VVENYTLYYMYDSCRISVSRQGAHGLCNEPVGCLIPPLNDEEQDTDSGVGCSEGCFRTARQITELYTRRAGKVQHLPVNLTEEAPSRFLSPVRNESTKTAFIKVCLAQWESDGLKRIIRI